MYKRGFAVSLFNKFDELAVLSDIIYENFTGDYGLYICSNYPNAEREIISRGIKYDGFIQGEDYRYEDDMFASDKRLALVCRSTDTVQKSCLMAMDNCEVVMHLHCDAWPLNEAEVVKHFDLIKAEGIAVAVRGLGWSYTAPDRPLGGIDDHFFVFSSEQIRKNNIFKFNVFDMLPHQLTIHGILGVQIICKLSRDKVFYFDEFEGHVIWEGVEKRMPYSPVKPSLFDQKRCFLHVHRESFPDELGASLQAFYLRENGLLSGAHIGKYLKKHYYAGNLIEELTSRLKKSEHSAGLLGLDYLKFSQEIYALENAVRLTTKLGVIKNHILLFLKKIVRYFLARFGLTIIKKQNIWPQKLDSIYSKLDALLQDPIKEKLPNGKKQ